jgi:hypothetical protein
MQWLRIRKATILLHRWEFLNFYWRTDTHLEHSQSGNKTQENVSLFTKL